MTIDSESDKVESKKIKKEWHPFVKGLFWSFVISSIVSIFGTLGASLVLFSPFSEQITNFLTEKKEKISELRKRTSGSTAIAQPISESNNLSRSVNILILGIEPHLNDSIVGNNLTFKGQIDTSLLVHFDPVSRSVKVLSIPRDSWLKKENGKFDRLRNFNEQNDPKAAVKTLSNNLDNLTIDRYIRMSTDVVARLIDAVGGIEVFVPEAVSYEDKTQKLKINLVAGWQTLGGEKAVHFLTYLDDRGDLGRVQRQQAAIEALQKRLQNPKNISRIPEIIKIFNTKIDSNLTLEEMLVLANFISELQRDNLQMVLLSGSYDSEGIWSVDKSDRERILKQFFATDGEKNNPSNNNTNFKRLRITIQNTTSRSQLSQELLNYLNRRNFDRVRIVEDLPMELRETQIIAQTGDLDAAMQLKNLLKFGRVNASSTGDTDSEITIQIGDDFAIDKIDN